jgi:nitroimidazol reductase NimA-like FMN-containing flavoprotein (pyridoxamine 5'-phosphate oxidase superfamily)
MKDIAELKVSIKKLGEEQLFAVLATANNNKPYTSLVAFALTEDLKKLVFVTPRDTRKFQYIEKNNFVSFLIDNSSNRFSDVAEASGITLSGVAHVANGEERSELLKIFSLKHPNLKEFSESKNSAVMCVDVKRYDVVERFQNVMVLEIKA